MAIFDSSECMKQAKKRFRPYKAYIFLIRITAVFLRWVTGRGPGHSVGVFTFIRATLLVPRLEYIYFSHNRAFQYLLCGMRETITKY